MKAERVSPWTIPWVNESFTRTRTTENGQGYQKPRQWLDASEAS